MIANEQQAVDEMLELFRLAWPSQYPVDYPNTNFEIPASGVIWVRPTIRHAVTRLSSLTGGLNSRKHKAVGTLYFQLFTQLNKGTDYALCNIITEAYRDKTTPGCIWFRNVRINEIGRDGAFYQTNVLVDFNYEMVK